MPETPAPERHSEDVAAHLWPVADLHHYPGNARLHDLERTRSSLREFGQVECLVGNIGTYTGRPREVLGGNGRLDVMIEDGWTHAGVQWVDLDEQRARALNLRLNPRSGKDPGFDQAALLTQLEELGDAHLDLAGYEISDRDEIAAALNAGAGGSGGAPGSGGQLDPADDDTVDAQWAVIVVCEDEVDQERTYEKLHGEGYTVRVVNV